MLLSYLTRMFSVKKSKRVMLQYHFLQYHFGAIILFGLLYWLQDIVYTYYISTERTKINNLGDWIWFSAITQTTVGYDKLAGKNYNENNTETAIFKIINFCQVSSIFILASLVF